MIIRRVKSLDKEKLIKLIEGLWKVDIRQRKLKKLTPFAQYKDIDREIAREAEEYLKVHYCTLVAEMDGHIVGYIAGTVKILENKKLDRAGYISNWYVSDGYRHKGVGKQLWDELVAYFKEQKCTHLLLDIWAENTTAHETYKRMGFIEEQINLVKLLT